MLREKPPAGNVQLAGCMAATGMCNWGRLLMNVANAKYSSWTALKMMSDAEAPRSYWLDAVHVGGLELQGPGLFSMRVCAHAPRDPHCCNTGIELICDMTYLIS
jgi:hypothetical protein